MHICMSVYCPAAAPSSELASRYTTHCSRLERFIWIYGIRRSGGGSPTFSPLWQATQLMYRRHNSSVTGQFNVCTAEAILDNCFTKLVFYGLPCFPFGCIISNIVNIMKKKKMGMPEKEGGFPVLDTDILNTFFFFLPTA